MCGCDCDVVCIGHDLNRYTGWWLQTTQATSGGAVTADSSCCANCVEHPRLQHCGARFTVFLACRPCGPAGWLALLLTKAGDVETNPGPSVWSPIASSTSINKLQVMQNAALTTATGCTQDTNIQHLHDETLTLPIHEHLQLHAPQYKHRHITSITSSTQTHHILQHSKARRLKKHYSTTAVTQQTFPQTPTQSLHQT